MRSGCVCHMLTCAEKICAHFHFKMCTYFAQNVHKFSAKRIHNFTPLSEAVHLTPFLGICAPYVNLC